MQYQFGPDSLHAHLEQARRIGASVHVCMRPGLKLDIDVPADLQSLTPSLAATVMPN